MTGVSLEERLVAGGAALQFPGEDALADEVVATIRARGGRWPRRRALLAAAAVLLLAAGAVVAVPASRLAVARWLGLARLEVRVVEEVPAAGRGLGPPLTLEDAAAAVGVDPFVAPALGEPVSVHAPGGRYVAARYDDDGTEVLVATLPGDLFHKRVADRGQVQPIEVHGAAAIWVTGAAHVLAYADETGELRYARLAADTLAWQQGDVIVRIEGDVPLERALDVASGVRLAGVPEG